MRRRKFRRRSRSWHHTSRSSRRARFPCRTRTGCRWNLARTHWIACNPRLSSSQRRTSHRMNLRSSIEGRSRIRRNRSKERPRSADRAGTAPCTRCPANRRSRKRRSGFGVRCSSYTVRTRRLVSSTRGTIACKRRRRNRCSRPRSLAAGKVRRIGMRSAHRRRMRRRRSSGRARCHPRSPRRHLGRIARVANRSLRRTSIPP